MNNERDSANGGAVRKSRRQIQSEAFEIHSLTCGMRGLIWAANYTEGGQYVDDANVALVPLTDIIIAKIENLIEALDQVKS